VPETAVTRRISLPILTRNSGVGGKPVAEETVSVVPPVESVPLTVVVGEVSAE
jgi:hypothetical protein